MNSYTFFALRPPLRNSTLRHEVIATTTEYTGPVSELFEVFGSGTGDTATAAYQNWRASFADHCISRGTVRGEEQNRPGLYILTVQETRVP